MHKYISKLLMVCSVLVVAILQMSLLKRLNEASPCNGVQVRGSTCNEAAKLDTTNESIHAQFEEVVAFVPKSRVMQVSHATSSNRYPDEYLAVKEYLKSISRTENVKLLSFGSSYGHEAISLATLYFNETEGFKDVSIYGFDIDEETINKAKLFVANYSPEPSFGSSYDNETDFNETEGVLDTIPLPIQFFDGRTTSLDVDGHYDAIFANSVLCDATSQPYTPEVVEAYFPFADFESALSSLDAVLNVGGVIAMINPSYYFEDSKMADRYEPIHQCLGNHVPKIDLKKHQFVMMNPNVTSDCVWKKLRSLK